MIIFLHGDDSFRSLEKLKEIRDKFLQKNSSGSGLSSFDFEENKSANFSEIKTALNSRGLFFEKQLVIIKNLIATGAKGIVEEFLEFLKSSKDALNSQDLVIVFWEKGEPKVKNELFKFLAAKAKKQEFEIISGVKLEAWINSKIKETNPKAKISAKAMEKLVAYTGGNLQILENEINKLANYKSEESIDEKDIETLVKENINSNIFETIEALSGGNKKLALKLFHEQLQKGEDPLYILMMYVYQFRNFLKIGEYYFLGVRNSYEIAKNSKTHPFVVKKILGQISKFSPERLKEIYKKLQIIDEKAKTGKSDVKLELDRFIVEI